MMNVLWMEFVLFFVCLRFEWIFARLKPYHTPAIERFRSKGEYYTLIVVFSVVGSIAHFGLQRFWTNRLPSELGTRNNIRTTILLVLSFIFVTEIQNTLARTSKRGNPSLISRSDVRTPSDVDNNIVIVNYSATHNNDEQMLMWLTNNA